MMLKKLLLTGVLAIPFLFSAQDLSESRPETEPQFSIIPSVGYAWRLASIPSGIPASARDYIKGLKSGVNFDISAYYHVKKGNGAIGLKYSQYSASSEGMLSLKDMDGKALSAMVSTKDNITFIGPSFMYSNFKADTKHKLYYDISVGVINYTTKTGNVKGTGSNIGLDASFAYQYAVSDKILIGPKIGVAGGTLSQMKYNGTTVNFGEDEKEGLTRLSLSAAATFRF